jgi:hypothetical protein
VTTIGIRRGSLVAEAVKLVATRLPGGTDAARPVCLAPEPVLRPTTEGRRDLRPPQSARGATGRGNSRATLVKERADRDGIFHDTGRVVFVGPRRVGSVLLKLGFAAGRVFVGRPTEPTVSVRIKSSHPRIISVTALTITRH